MARPVRAGCPEPGSLFAVSARKRFPWARLWVGVAGAVAIALTVWFVLKVLV
ncbi:hypothetical protein BH09ACT5_BH09ACT5_11270 [soil metagenome]